VKKWKRYPRHNVPASTGAVALTLAECQEHCIVRGPCFGVDWWQGFGCWLHGPWNAREELTVHNSIDHYSIYRDADCTGRRYTPFWQEFMHNHWWFSQVAKATFHHSSQLQTWLQTWFSTRFAARFSTSSCGFATCFRYAFDTFSTFLSKTWSRTCCINLDMSHTCGRH